MTKENKKEEQEVVEQVAEVIEKDLDAPTQPNQISKEDANALQEKINETSKQLEAILRANGMAFQPILNVSQFSIRPDVALVPVSEPVTEQEPQTVEPTPITGKDIEDLVKE